MKSVRFFPHWDTSDPEQVVGFLQLVNHVTARLGYGLHWVEVGGYYGESATLVAGFPQVERLDVIESNDTHVQALQKRFAKCNRVTIQHARSMEAAAAYKPRSLNVVYIDATHSKEAVAADIEAWFPKIRIGGFICGHDYHAGFPGVMEAVGDRFVGVQTFCDSSWMVEVT